MNKEKGALGEKIAENFLENKGYRILCRNWTCCWGEIDLIVERNDVLVFVEVKYRSSTKYGAGADSINFSKKSHLRRSISIFLASYRGNQYRYRFDVICLSGKDQNVSLEHYENVDLS